MKPGRWILAALGIAAAVIVIRRHLPDSAGGSAPPGAPVRTRTARVVPAGVRIKVEVLNATDTRGLARQATDFLRDAGFDVVAFGNAPERLDTTVVLVRSGHPDWAALAVRAMRGARAEPRPDSSHFLDLTVLVGRNWTPPRDPLSP